MILSIDVGIKNLAMCLLDEDKNNLVVEWDVDGIPPQHRDGVYVSMRDHLDARPWVLNAKTILIEKQPDRNKKMVSVMHFLHAYFIIKCPKAETILYDARHKIPDVAGPGKAQYNKRKKVSIERCEDFIRSNSVNSHWIDTFVKSKKKDADESDGLDIISLQTEIANILNAEENADCYNKQNMKDVLDSSAIALDSEKNATSTAESVASTLLTQYGNRYRRF